MPATRARAASMSASSPRSVGGPDLDQDGGGVLAQFPEVGRHARLVLDGTQRGPVHEFHGGDGPARQGHGGPAGGVDGRVEHERGGLVGMFRHGAVGDLGDEGQGAFGADDQMEQDGKGVLEIEKGIEAVAGGVLDLELAADALGQRRIGQDLGPDGGEFRQKSRAGGGKALARDGIGRVEGLAVREDKFHGLHGLVAVSPPCRSTCPRSCWPRCRRSCRR